MKKKSILFTMLCCAILFSNCASILTSTSYPVVINSEPNGAKVTIVNKKGEEVYSGKTPVSAKLKASNKYMSGERYTVTISKPGYGDEVSYIESKMEELYWGNILFGGLVGMLVIDPLTGAMFKIDTKSINVTLDKEEAKAE